MTQEDHENIGSPGSNLLYKVTALEADNHVVRVGNIYPLPEGFIKV